jgi:hypothetical protein
MAYHLAFDFSILLVGPEWFGCGYFRTTVQEGYNRRWS